MTRTLAIIRRVVVGTLLLLFSTFLHSVPAIVHAQEGPIHLDETGKIGGIFLRQSR